VLKILGELSVKCNHFAAGALMSADDPQILSTRKNSGYCRPCSRNRIPKESQLKGMTNSSNAMKPRNDEYNSDLFLSFPDTAHQMSQYSLEYSKNLGSHELFFQELR
jgi:hypothetical protein